jgi:hypothetical protein
MPLQNRVDPWGRLHAVSARGTLTGNRGIIHNEQKQIVRQWSSKAWITCTLEFRGRQRVPMGQRSWTELFFLDEATAFAAGHRPCAYCRRERYNEFKAAWLAANPGKTSKNPRIQEIDAVLHAERVNPDGSKRTWEAELGSLPDGVIVEFSGKAWVLWKRRAHRWDFNGTASANNVIDATMKSFVLTPRSIVSTFQSGFVPDIRLA